MDSIGAGRETPSPIRCLKSLATYSFCGYPNQSTSPSLSQIFRQSVSQSVSRQTVGQIFSQSNRQTVRQSDHEKYMIFLTNQLFLTPLISSLMLISKPSEVGYNKDI